MSQMPESEDKAKILRRRQQLFHEVTNRITKALGPFVPHEMILFDPKGTVSSVETVFDREGRRHWQRSKKRGFIASLYASLPRSTLRRFLLLTSEEHEPTAKECRKLKRELLGRARQKLMHELTGRIQRLPHLIGSNTGWSKEERRKLRTRVNQETRARHDKAQGLANEETPKKGYKKEAIQAIAGDLKMSERQVWRIIRDA